MMIGARFSDFVASFGVWGEGAPQLAPMRLGGSGRPPGKREVRSGIPEW